MTEKHLVPVHLEQLIVSSETPSMDTEAQWMQPIRDWLLVPSAEAAEPPSNKDIELLQQAMAAYSNNDSKAADLLTQAIAAWKEQPADELAALYRVRADCYMNLLQPQEAQQDYTLAIQLLTGPGGEAADSNELPAAYLGRARAVRSISPSTKEQSLLAAKDYQVSLRLTSQGEWDTDQENEQDGAKRNPYAAWEWGMSLRNAGQYQQAAKIHVLASQAFNAIGDKARDVISELDAGIDLAAASDTNLEDAKLLLTKAIDRTTSVEGRDVALLQRVIAKEGEGRIALASILWSSSDGKPDAEAQLGTACQRLEQLDQDALARNSAKTTAVPQKLKFSIDDQAGALDVSCARFKNQKFLSETLQWPESLQDKVRKLNDLK